MKLARLLMWGMLAVLAMVALPSMAQAQTCTVGGKGVAPTASLTFTAPTLNTDGTAIKTPLTYNVYQSTSSGTEKKILTGVTGSPVSVTVGLLPGTTSYFEISVTDGNGTESAVSNEVCKSFPASTPGSVTITIT